MGVIVHSSLLEFSHFLGHIPIEHSNHIIYCQMVATLRLKDIAII